MTKVAESKIIVGLEIGTHKVVAVVGEVLPDGVINVIGSGVSPSKGVQGGSVVDLDAAVSSIQRAIEEAESISECKIMGVTLALSGAHITAFNESGTVPLSGEVKAEDLDNAIHIARSIKLPDGLETLHIIPQEYKVDRLPATKNPLGLSGMRLQAQAHLITCHNDWLRNLKNAVERSKLKIDQIIFSGLASSYSVLTEDEKELGVCLIDIGSGTMDVLVYTDGALRYSKVIPFGGYNITDYIANMLTTSRNDAENIKVQYGSAISPPTHFPEKKIEVAGLGGRAPRTFSKEQLSKITSQCYQDLLGIIANELTQLRTDLYQKGIKQELIAGIVLTGGGSQIEDIVECAKSVFGLQVRVGYPLNITGLTDYVNKPQYATVLGLLQYSHYNEDSDTTPQIPGEGFVEWLKKAVKKTVKFTKDKF
ncbi:cell division protein FtsA [Ursidibacter maritimus]|uniref:Cell division protein FtsA n=1 Tax=Ursidibacter maritimus TaxID=1331689 RepID=A0A949WNF1_9PAST|nr:cell division protein FtsA [Ursidibacter maritimus]KAE9541956.1 cell division protein FtsA [Ursidibacter maritimus]MBV6523242.1 cell division protein FtsA [Ursidibacter maritimus]MBV6525698.1 cell division protein FtsA [Ursidibacter maritimus]MBV6527406.1 cell division protein FtsA [Ursidibacter maritimus]MBV6529431.1 cell division protein FtsA [Ursidibacter maritimus]